MPLDCYDYQDYDRNYNGLPDCRTSYNVMEFSVHQKNVANGLTKYVRTASTNGAPWHVGWYGYGCCGAEGSTGSAVSVPANTTVTLEWSCQPYQNSTHSHCSFSDPYGNCYDTYEESVRVSYFENAPLVDKGVSSSGSNPQVGTTDVTPTATTNYSVTCRGSAGSYTLTIPVTVGPPPPCNSAPNSCGMVNSGTIVGGVCNAVTPPNSACAPAACNTPGAACTLTGCSDPLLPGESCTLSWSCSAPPFTSSAGGGFSTDGNMSGSTQVSPTETTTYTLSCGSPTGSSTGTVTAMVGQPELTLTAQPTRVRKEDSTTLTWSAQNVTPGSCRVTGTDNSSWSGDSGSEEVTINAITTFTLTCSIPSGPTSKSVTVGIVPTFEEI